MSTFKAVFLPDSPVLSSTFSPNNQAVTIVVQNLIVELLSVQKSLPPAQISVGRGLDDNQLVAARSGNLFVELQGDEPSVNVQVDIRGSVDTEPGARAVLFSRIAGVSFVDELATGVKNQTFTLKHVVSVSPSNGLSATFLLLIDRDIVDGALPFITAMVDAVDLTFETPAVP